MRSVFVMFSLENFSSPSTLDCFSVFGEFSFPAPLVTCNNTSSVSTWGYCVMFYKSHLRTRVLNFLLMAFYFFFSALLWEYLPLSAVAVMFTNSSGISWNNSDFHLLHVFSVYIIAAIPAFLSAAPLCMILLLPNLWEAPGTSCSCRWPCVSL